MGGGDFSPKKILKKTPQKTTVFEMDARYATDRFLRLKKWVWYLEEVSWMPLIPQNLRWLLHALACILSSRTSAGFFLGTLLHSINYIVFIYSNLLQHLYILCLAGFNILISMFPFPLSSLSLYIRYFG